MRSYRPLIAAAAVWTAILFGCAMLGSCSVGVSASIDHSAESTAAHTSQVPAITPTVVCIDHIEYYQFRNDTGVSITYTYTPKMKAQGLYRPVVTC